MFEIFRQVYRVPLVLARAVFANPLGLFVYGILSKWYILIMFTAVIVAYWGLKGLEQAGILSAAEKIVTQAMLDAKSIAKYCTPKIVNLNDAWNCVQNPPSYEADKNEIELQKTIDKAMKVEKNQDGHQQSGSEQKLDDENQNPYE